MPPIRLERRLPYFLTREPRIRGLVLRSKCPVAKRKATSKAKKSSKRSDQGRGKQEIQEIVTELESILEGLKTSTVSFCRERLRLSIERLRSVGESS